MLMVLQYSKRISYLSANLVQLCKFGTKLFVGGLSYDTNETALREAFIQHGNIIEVRVICDHVTAKSRGYGFVRFSSEDAAASALKQLDGQEHPGSLCKQAVTMIEGLLHFEIKPTNTMFVSG